jgi:arylamine N-acetyltransferase
MLTEREYMEQAKKIWEELNLPPLRPEAPWFGYSLGDWTERNELMAKRAVKSDYFITGEEIAKQRRSDLPMNTEIKHHMDESFFRKEAKTASKSLDKNTSTAKSKSALKAKALKGVIAKKATPKKK